MNCRCEDCEHVGSDFILAIGGGLECPSCKSDNVTPVDYDVAKTISDEEDLPSTGEG
jgi:hypothetical protein